MDDKQAMEVNHNDANKVETSVNGGSYVYDDKLATVIKVEPANDKLVTMKKEIKKGFITAFLAGGITAAILSGWQNKQQQSGSTPTIETNIDSKLDDSKTFSTHNNREQAIAKLMESGLSRKEAELKVDAELDTEKIKVGCKQVSKTYQGVSEILNYYANNGGESLDIEDLIRIREMAKYDVKQVCEQSKIASDYVNLVPSDLEEPIDLVPSDLEEPVERNR